MSPSMEQSTIEYIEHATGRFFLATERDEEHIVLEALHGDDERNLSIPEFKAQFVPVLKHGGTAKRASD